LSWGNKSQLEEVIFQLDAEVQPEQMKKIHARFSKHPFFS